MFYEYVLENCEFRWNTKHMAENDVEYVFAFFYLAKREYLFSYNSSNLNH